MFVTSDQADTLFSKLNSAPAVQVLEQLQFVSRFDAEESERPFFEFDTDLNHAWYLIGLAHEALGNQSEAARSFRRAAEVWPSDAEAFLAYSNVEQDLDAQIAFLTWGLTKTDDPRIMFNLANAYLDTGRPIEAMQALDGIPSKVSFWDDVVESKVLAASLATGFGWPV